MGLISDIKAINAIQIIKNGGCAKLSVSSITSLLINLSDANIRLPKETFNEIYSLYKKKRKCSSKIEMNLEAYYKTAADILCEFDKISPCELYLNLEPAEIAALISESRKSEDSSDN